MEATTLNLLNHIIEQQASLKNLVQYQSSQLSELLERQQLADRILHRLQTNFMKANKKQQPQNYSSPSKINTPSKHSYYQNYDQNPYGTNDLVCLQNNKNANPAQTSQTSDRVTNNMTNASRVSQLQSQNSSQSSLHRKKIHSIPKNLLNSKIFLRPSPQNVNLHKFIFEENKIIAKSNGWTQLLMDKIISLKQQSFFEISVTKSEHHNIMIGIVSTERMECQNSHGTGKEIAINLNSNEIFFRGGVLKNSKTEIPKKCVIKVYIEGDSMRWMCGQKVLGSVAIPPELRLCPLTPYFELCTKNDTVELL